MKNPKTITISELISKLQTMISDRNAHPSCTVLALCGCNRLEEVSSVTFHGNCVQINTVSAADK